MNRRGEWQVGMSAKVDAAIVKEEERDVMSKAAIETLTQQLSTTETSITQLESSNAESAQALAAQMDTLSTQVQSVSVRCDDLQVSTMDIGGRVKRLESDYIESMRAAQTTAQSIQTLNEHVRSVDGLISRNQQ